MSNCEIAWIQSRIDGKFEVIGLDINQVIALIEPDTFELIKPKLKGPWLQLEDALALISDEEILAAQSLNH